MGQMLQKWAPNAILSMRQQQPYKKPGVCRALGVGVEQVWSGWEWVGWQFSIDSTAYAKLHIFSIMNISISEAVFPSYNRIRNNILRQQTANYQRKIAQLNTHLAQMQAAHDFKADHEKIKQSILTLAPPAQSAPFFKDPLKIEPAHRHHPSGQFNAESLNYYIDDDGDSDNNYETFLKFKKKALERDLEEQEMEKHQNKREKRKQKEEEEEFFKNLYVLPPQTLAATHTKTHKRAQSANIHPVKYGQVKQNAALFMSSLIKASATTSQRRLQAVKKSGVGVGVGVGVSRVQESEVERSAFDNNRKYLTQNYPQILRKLENTNIVKWRLLNAKQ